MTGRLRGALLAGVCGLCASPASIAWAQSTASGAGAAQSDVTQEVVVTAQKRSERLLDVPLAVQAISKTQIQDSGASDVADLVSAIPGASIVSNSTPGFETVQIRGISSGTTGDGLVGYYIDDTPFGIPNLQLTPPSRLLDLDRVEVIRGPSGTIYGQGSMGGTIKLVTTKPNTETYSGTIQAEVSGTDGAGANGAVDFAVNVPIVQDQLAVRVTGGYQYLSGYANVPEQNKTDANGFQGQNIRATVLWTPTPTLDFTGFIWHIVNKQDFSNALTPHNAESASLIFTPFGQNDIGGTDGKKGFTDIDADIYSGTIHWRTGLGDVTSNSSYIQHKLNFNDPLLTILDNVSDFKTNSFTQEVRLASLPTAPFTYLVGGSYRDATIHSTIDYYEDLHPLGIPAVVPIIDIAGPLNTQSYSVFGEISKAFFDGKLEPLVGLRYFHDDRSTSGVDLSSGAPVPQTPNSASYHSLNPRFNLKYHLTADGLVYLNAAKGFRSGALQTEAQATAGSAALGLPPGTIKTSVSPDSLWTYEAGVKWQLLQHTVIFEGAYYHTDWKNVLVQFASTAVISLANAGNASIDGLDGGVVWRTPVTGLNLSANGNLNNSRFTSVVGALAVSTAIKVNGQIPNVPRSNATVSADYKHSLDWFGGSTGTIYAAYSYRDREGDATTKGLYSGSPNDVTLRAGLRHGPYRVDAFIDNATNDHTPTVSSLTAYEILYPRRIGLQFGYDF